MYLPSPPFSLHPHLVQTHNSTPASNKQNLRPPDGGGGSQASHRYRSRSCDRDIYYKIRKHSVIATFNVTSATHQEVIRYTTRYHGLSGAWSRIKLQAIRFRNQKKVACQSSRTVRIESFPNCSQRRAGEKGRDRRRHNETIAPHAVNSTKVA